ncbi:peptidoglycan-binding domain-containing protein [Herbivorax sp. ANBcel31]|uniref:peptidoglycan-binding domain-containing protein n=1 Tax=Herbivorax sp. ANBcel31 TaxID=3069754 RepID=UPI0027AF915E|nr:peptidoglycan-binding domain-containing protein [Herbivorax sp. ANBcel31]MDQ2085770.1 peptidoglycan-binding domain-containing protein [Herbivorax sp. ANBcel31]
MALLQKLLITHGYLKMPDGVDFGTFGPLTKEAVENYQRDNRNLEVDGIVGKNTWMELVSWDTDDMLWDYGKEQPNRETWTYRYTLNNLFYYCQTPKVELTSPTVETRLKLGEKLEITGFRRDCHHIALFNTSIHLDHDIDAHGIYDIQLKGRSVPNGDDDTTLGEATKMKASPKAIEAVNRVNSESRLTLVSYRKNILFQTEYKISGIVATYHKPIVESKEQFYYIQYFRCRMNHSAFNPFNHKIRDKYFMKNYLERKFSCINRDLILL